MNMCKAFSCIIHKNKKVTWKFGVDSHEDLIKLAGYEDDKSEAHELLFARVEISPKDGNYLDPEVPYIFKLDEKQKPSWWSDSYENKCWDAQEQWLKKLNSILVRKQIINPFQIAPPKITEAHIKLVRDWASVRASVGTSVWASVEDSVWDSVWASVEDSVWDSVGDSVWASVEDSVWDSVWASVEDSVWDSVGDSVWAYCGSFFVLPRDAWKYTTYIETDEYPFLPLVKLWEQGLVPSFDGEVWRMHGGKDADILWEGIPSMTDQKPNEELVDDDKPGCFGGFGYINSDCRLPCVWLKRCRQSQGDYQ
jgi:hypothetical protein